jgi:GTP-binding protein
MVFTKTDKLKPAALQRNIDVYNEEMFKIWEELPHQFTTSAVSALGREEILGFIEETNTQFRG